MQIGKRERANGTIVTGPWLDRPAPRRPSPVATKAKRAQPQQPVLAMAGPPTVTLTHLKPDATGTLAPRASAARRERARDRSKTTICRDFQDSRLGSRLVTGRTSRIHPQSIAPSSPQSVIVLVGTEHFAPSRMPLKLGHGQRHAQIRLVPRDDVDGLNSDEKFGSGRPASQLLSGAQ